MFELESNLVQSFIDLTFKHKVNNYFSSNYLACEYDYNSGRVDLVSKNHKDELIAIEAKLSKWKEALNQAYRNTSFAHYSFVLLPLDVAFFALEREKEFLERRVGILTISENQIKVLLHPSKSDPIQPWLTQRAFELIQNQKYEKSKAG